MSHHYWLVVMMIIAILLAEVALFSVDFGCFATSSSASGRSSLLVLPLHGPTQAAGTLKECYNMF